MENEQAVIGALLIDASLINEVDLIPADFSVETYRIIYQSIIDMTAASETIDVLTISNHLEMTSPSESGRDWLVICGRSAKECYAPSNVKAYAGIVKHASRVRSAKTIAAELLNTIETAEDSAETIDGAVQKLMELSVTRKSYEKSISQAIKGAIELIETANDAAGPVGIPCGLTDLDEILSGFHNSDLYIVAARPAMGKTAVLLNFLDNSKVPAGLISAEQPNDQIGLRMIAVNGLVNSHRMRTGNLSDHDFDRVTVTTTRMHEEARIWINDKSGISILEVIRQARRWKHQHKIEALYVDYVQRIKWTDQKMARWEQVGNVVMALKELARELQIPVIALAQVNRNIENRENKRPHMGDIANSSEIEKEADCIMTLYRDEVYDPDTADKGIIEIDVMKNRHGPTGYKKFVWDERYMKVKDLDTHQYANQNSEGMI